MYYDLSIDYDSYILTKEDFDISIKFDWFSMDSTIPFEDWNKYFDVQFRVSRTSVDPNSDTGEI